MLDYLCLYTMEVLKEAGAETRGTGMTISDILDYRPKSVKEDEIYSAPYKRLTLTRKIKSLLDEGYIDYGIMYRQAKSYYITTKGVKELNEINGKKS